MGSFFSIESPQSTIADIFNESLVQSSETSVANKYSDVKYLPNLFIEQHEHIEATDVPRFTFNDSEFVNYLKENGNNKAGAKTSIKKEGLLKK
jgi:hypothetical protein